MSQPQPPLFPNEVSELEPNEIFWIVKHGIKMTGMPSFDATHNDETIWSIVAFVLRLPGMTAGTYAGFRSSHSGGEKHFSGDQSH